MKSLESVLCEYEDELLNSVTPFWLDNFVDRQCGGFYSFLDRDGSVYCSDKHMWMQWRSVYMLATMHNSEYSRDGWLRLAEDGFDFAFRHGRRPDGGYHFAIDRHGRPLGDDGGAFGIFTESFVSIACSALYKATGRGKYLDEAVSSTGRYLENVARAEEVAAKSGGLLSLGHHMIFVNMATEFKNCVGDGRYEADAARSAEMVWKFYDPEGRRFFEHVRPDGSFDLESPRGRLLNPGHALETMWFLIRHAEVAGDDALAARACEKVGEILEYGWDKRHGGVLYLMDALGRPLPDPKSYLKAWWPQNEALVAALLAYKATGDELYLGWFHRINDWAREHFRDAGHGEWFMYLTSEGGFYSPVKGCAWKTFFHVPRCLLNCVWIMKSMEGDVSI